MNKSFYTATVGAHQQQLRLDVHGNNIANVNTNGFRARIPAFSSLMTGLIRGIDKDLPRGVGAKLEDSELDMRPGKYNETNRVLDFAIDGEGYFMLMEPGSGEISFTRDGSFTMMDVTLAVEGSDEGETVWRLSDGNGRFVIGADGQIIDVPVGTTDLLGIDFNIGIFDLTNRNHNGMLSLSENRLLWVEKNGEPYLIQGKRPIQGVLEASNVDLANEIAKVIESQRSFQYLIRMITSSDEIETTVNTLR